jgi:tripartite-type tricarboxylate transporter receptor subunit TctC
LPAIAGVSKAREAAMLPVSNRGIAMKLARRQILQLAAGAAALPAVSRFAWAQAYPARPITLVVPFAAGGPTDTIARIMGERMRASLGQTIIIENTTGAAGSIGVGRVARAEPDGYTVGIGHWSTHVVNGAIYQLPYDVLNDFEPISLVAANAQLAVVRKSFPANNLKELIDWLKANPDKASQGTAGAGSASHVSGVYFQKATGTRFQFVPYRGTGPAMQDLVAGQIDLMFDQAANSLPQVRNGNVKAFAVTAKSRLPSAPDIPTMDEAGMPGFYISVWHGLWVPKGTPKDITARLPAPSWRHWPIPRCAAASTISARRFRRASSRRRRRCSRITRPRSRNGGRSSRPRTSRASDLQNFINFVARTRPCPVSVITAEGYVSRVMACSPPRSKIPTTRIFLEAARALQQRKQTS